MRAQQNIGESAAWKELLTVKSHLKMLKYFCLRF
jgi:hypothetical protein